MGISIPVSPMKTVPTEDIPGNQVGIDFLAPVPNTQQYLLVVIDTYAKFPEVEIVHSTSTQAVIRKFDQVFAMHGIPFKLTSDNGPPFDSAEFERYMKAVNIEWNTNTHIEWNIMATGKLNVQNFNKTLLKCYK